MLNKWDATSMPKPVLTLFSIFVFASFLTVQCFAQNDKVPEGTSEINTLAAPPATAIDAAESHQPLLSPLLFRPNGCFSFSYYNSSAGTISVQDTVPTQKWAVKVNLASMANQVALCTLWTIATDFRWVPTSPGPGDTLHIFMREVNPPYNMFYHVRYLVRLGENRGGIEVDPPIPGNARPIVNPIRDVYVGMYITGTSGNDVTWRLKTPPQHNRTFLFSGGSSPSPVSPSTYFGSTGDLILTTTWCFPPIPVELSLFSAYADNANVHLEWVTEEETNSFQFEVQRKQGSEGIWESRGIISAAGASRTQQRYTFTDPLDEQPGEQLWYRLRQTDFDGTYEYFGPINVSSAMPSVGFELKEVYPNPVLAGAGTAIGYDMPADSDVQITVFDALGRECAELVSGTVRAGYHEVLWYPSSSLTEGIYYVTMRTPSFTRTRKVTLLR